MTGVWPPSGFEQRTITANGTELGCVVGGSGPPMVLLHGWPQTGRTWRLVMPTLAQSHTVVVPDLRGAGSSALSDGGYAKVNQAEDLRALLRGVNLDGPAVVVGHDIGAMIAYALAARYPDEVAALVLMEVLLPGLGLEPLMDPAQGGMFHFGLFMTPDAPELLFEGHEQAFMAWWFDRLSAKPGAIPVEDVAIYAEAYTGHDRLRAGFAQYRSYEEDARDNRRLAQVPLPMPVLAIGGAASVGTKLAQSMEPLCEVLTTAVAPCGHFVPEEAPDWFIGELMRFLAVSQRPVEPGLVDRVLPAWVAAHLPGKSAPTRSTVAVRGGIDAPASATPQHRGTRDAETLWMAGDRYTVLLTGAETAGRLALFHFLVPPDSGPPPHTHAREDETYYVLRGRVTFTVGGQTFEAGPGEVAYGPRGVTHGFRNAGDVDAEMVCVAEPAGIETFFRSAGRTAVDRLARPPAPNAADKARLAEAAPQFGIMLE